jgi:hypothetical protein
MIYKIKKSQTTLFIILAVLIVGIMSSILIFGNHKQSENSLNSDYIYSFTQDCVKQTAEDSVYYIGSTGGYFASPNLSTESNIAYYLYNKNNYIPSKEQIEKELAKYVNQMLFFCTKDFIDFPDFQIKQDKISSDVKILDGKVVFNIKYPLSITKNNKTEQITNFESEIPVRLNVVYDAIQGIMYEQMKHTENICISCTSNIILDKDLYLKMNYLDSNRVTFKIIDKKSKIEDKGDFAFNFANKYEW